MSMGKFEIFLYILFVLIKGPKYLIDKQSNIKIYKSVKSYT